MRDSQSERREKEMVGDGEGDEVLAVEVKPEPNNLPAQHANPPSSPPPPEGPSLCLPSGFPLHFEARLAISYLIRGNRVCCHYQSPF